MRPYAGLLKADAAFSAFREESYFPKLSVRGPLPSKVEEPIDVTLKKIRGQIVLVGDSGLGKSSFLLHRVRSARNALAYLPAHRCTKGVKEAVHAKLQIASGDRSFLDLLIDRGALDFAIDGLNEVTAETRITIRDFVEHHSRVNVILTTQPIEWEPPSNARQYEMMPARET